MKSSTRFMTFWVIIFSLVATNSSQDNCIFNVKITRHLLNEGFHRNISYGVIFTGTEDETSYLYEDCTLGLEQKLPMGVYINPDEIADLRRINRVNIFSKSRVNVELPAEQSEESSVFVAGRVRGGEARLWVPVHARYHSARVGGGFARNMIHFPVAYLRCPDRRLEDCGGRQRQLPYLCNEDAGHCRWQKLPITLMSDPLVWQVPVGNLSHYYLVSVGTAAVVAVASLYLLSVIHHTKMATRRKRV